jgi:outer membrane protein
MSSTASAIGFEMSVGAWNQSPSGDISYKALSPGQDSLSIKDNLEYSDKTKVFARVKIDTLMGLPNIYLMATPMEFSGRGSKNGTFTFGNITFNGSVPFTSELKLDHYDIGLYYGIPGLKMLTVGTLNVDLGLDARIINFNARITGTDSINSRIITQSESFVTAIPMLYLGIQVRPVKLIAFEGEARVLTYAGNHYYDYIGRVKLKPLGPVFAAAGYRHEDVSIDANDVKADVKFGGPFGEIGVEF